MTHGKRLRGCVAPALRDTESSAPRAAVAKAAALSALAAISCSDGSGEGVSTDQGAALEAGRPGCFVLPAASVGVTRSYRVLETGSLEPAGEVGGDVNHMRATFHPDGSHVYITTLDFVAQERWTIHVRTFRYSRVDCSIGPLVATTEVEGDTASNSRIYGLMVHPSGRWLYQTTGSSRSIRLFDLGADRVPTLRARYDVTQGGRFTCAQARRLALASDGKTLYSNCNNVDAEQDVALQVWDIAADGSLELAQHVVLEGMDGGVTDPVLHPSGRWLYQPVGTAAQSAPQGPGAYVVTFEVMDDGRLRLQELVPVRNVTSTDSVRSLANTQIFPSTLITHPDGTTAYVTTHAALDFRAFPHEIVRYRIERGGSDLVEVDRRAVSPALPGSSHHGGALVSVGASDFLYSYLTDYDETRGGVLQQYRIASDHELRPLDPPYVATGLADARQPIVAR